MALGEPKCQNEILGVSAGVQNGEPWEPVAGLLEASRGLLGGTLGAQRPPRRPQAPPRRRPRRARNRPKPTQKPPPEQSKTRLGATSRPGGAQTPKMTPKDPKMSRLGVDFEGILRPRTHSNPHKTADASETRTHRKKERRFPFHVESGLCWRSFFDILGSLGRSCAALGPLLAPS